MPKKQQGWITFQSSMTERQILEQYCEAVQRTKTDVLRELLRNLSQMLSFDPSTGHPVILDLKTLATYQLEHRLMQSSARNALKGIVKKVTMGAVNAEITIEIVPGVEVVSIITKTSAETMGLVEGKEAYALIKSSDVMVAVE
jgi:molybdopterin-binding protein